MLNPVSSQDQQIWSVRQTIIFWWVAFFLLQQTLRFVLIAGTPGREPASVSLLLHTLWFGFRGDLIVATLMVLLGIGLAFLVTCVIKLVPKGRPRVHPPILSSRALTIIMTAI